MSEIRKALMFSFAERYTALAINIASMMVLARLLTPRDIGVFSVVAALVGLADMVRAFGVGQYIIQEPELTRERIRAAFGLTLLIAWLVAGVLFVSSGLVATFYREPGVRHVMLVLAGRFLLVPFGSITIAVLRRELNFQPIYYIYTASGVARPLTAVVLAVLGFGYMSLAWGALAGTAVSVMATSLYRPKHLPLFPGLREFRRVFAFGSKVSAARLVQEAGDGAPELVLGRVLTMAAVGMFGRAMGMIQLFDRFVTQAILPAVLPHLSAKYRAGASVQESYLRVVAYQTGLAWPFYGFVEVMAYPMVRLLYGSQWDAAVPVVKILCVYAAVSALYAFVDQVFLAVGAVGKNMQFQCISVSVKFILVVFAVPFGLQTVAYALLVLSIFECILSYWLMIPNIGIRVSDFWTVSWKSVCVLFFSMIGPVGEIYIVGIRPDPYILPFLLTFAMWGIGWIVGVLIVEHPLKKEIVPLFNRAVKGIGLVGA